MEKIRIQGARFGGDMGMEIIAKRTPEQLRDNPDAKTGRYLS